jgi:outer membrane protein assembly factor BamB
MNRRTFVGNLRLGFALLTACLVISSAFAAPPAPSAKPLLLVVMDPLAKELACACVKGQGQRDYRKLAALLESTLKHKVAIEFTDDLADTLSLADAGPEVIVVGDRSHVAHAAVAAKLPVQPVAELTDPDGQTTLPAAFVVQARDPAKELKDLRGRRVLYGVPAADGKHAAALAALRAAGVEPAANSATRANYSEAALDVLDSSDTPAPVGVIPAYGPALLVGCGSVRAGELRVVGRSEPVPFITVFVADAIAAAKREKILQALLAVARDAKLLQALESKDGFKPLAPKTGALPSRAEDWPDWRGPRRDGRVPVLPAQLAAQPKVIWKRGAMTGGLAGLTVSDGRLLLAERDLEDTHDLYRCLDAATGETLWRVSFPASGQLDYGQSPRATPVLHTGRAYLLGAFGELRCVNVTNGAVLWRRDLLADFHATLPTWGLCSPPLIVDDLLIVNPGGPDASIVALDCVTGRTRWATPGAPAGYGAFICGEFGGRRQIVGHDQRSLGGWDVRTGARLWELVPPTDGDFNVPTPIAVDGALLVATENNGARLYRFDAQGRIIPKPACESTALAPDTATPVVARGRVFGIHQGLRCLDLRAALQPVWHRKDDAPGDHAALLTDGERVLILTHDGELILLDAGSADGAILSRARLFDEGAEVYAHPALVGTRLYARGNSSVVCVDLQPH